MNVLAWSESSEMVRKILHLDLDAFFCAVEELHDPSLRGCPFAVGGRAESRGVVASCSYAARRFGVCSAMPMARAVRICPELRVVYPHYRDYSTMSHEVMACLSKMTPLVEQISIDEAFLDVSDLPEPGEILAKQLQTEIWDSLNLPCSIGVAANKLVAKIATDVAKASSSGEGYPNAVLVVPHGKERTFLDPLPSDRLWGVGPKTRERMAALGMRTIGDIARQSDVEMSTRFGKHGSDLVRRARGIDDRPVVTTHTIKSISQEVTFPRDVSDRTTLLQTLHSQAEQVGRRLRSKKTGGFTVRVKLRKPDFTTLSRQVTLDQPTDEDSEIYAVAVQLFQNMWKTGESVRLLGLGVSRLGSPVRQLSLWGSQYERMSRLHSAIDTLRDKFDDRIVKRGTDLLDEDSNH